MRLARYLPAVLVTVLTGACLFATGCLLDNSNDAKAFPIVLSQFQSVPTSGARDWRPFSIGSDTYLAVANDFNGVSPDINSTIYRWNGTQFVEFQQILTNWGTEWEFFEIAGDQFLVIANHHTYDAVAKKTVYDIASKIYKWNGTGFQEYQSIMTSGASGWKFFSIGEESFLALANNGGTAGNYLVDSKIYRWDGMQFVEFQAIPTKAALRWEFFSIGSEHFLAVANYSTNFTTDFNIDSVIYKWNGTKFTEFQAIPTSGAHYWKHFNIGDSHFLAVANLHDGPNRTHLEINSKIYQWSGSSFVEYQAILTRGCVSWDFVSYDSNHYLVASNWKNDAGSYLEESVIYRWTDSGFSLHQAIPTNGATDCAFFTIDSRLYMAIANGGGGEAGPNTNSNIYRF